MDKASIMVTMSLEEFEWYQSAVKYRDNCIDMFNRAVDEKGNAVLTEELKNVIEEVYC